MVWNAGQSETFRNVKVLSHIPPLIGGPCPSPVRMPTLAELPSLADFNDHCCLQIWPDRVKQQFNEAPGQCEALWQCRIFPPFRFTETTSPTGHLLDLSGLHRAAALVEHSLALR